MEEKNILPSLGQTKRGMTLKEVAAIVKSVREERGLSQEKLGELAGKDQSAVSNLENGKKVSADVYDKVFAALDIKLPISFPRE